MNVFLYSKFKKIIFTKKIFYREIDQNTQKQNNITFLSILVLQRVILLVATQFLKGKLRLTLF